MVKYILYYYLNDDKIGEMEIPPSVYIRVVRGYFNFCRIDEVDYTIVERHEKKTAKEHICKCKVIEK